MGMDMVAMLLQSWYMSPCRDLECHRNTLLKLKMERTFLLLGMGNCWFPGYIEEGWRRYRWLLVGWLLIGPNSHHHRYHPWPPAPKTSPTTTGSETGSMWMSLKFHQHNLDWLTKTGTLRYLNMAFWKPIICKCVFPVSHQNLLFFEDCPTCHAWLLEDKANQRPGEQWSWNLCCLMISSVFLRMVILSFNSIYKYELWLAISPNYSEDLWEYRKKTSCISRTDIALEHCSPKMSLRHRLWQLLNLTCPWRCGAGVGNAQGWTLGQVPFGFDRSNGSSFWAWVFGSFPHSVGKSPFGIGKSTVNEPFSIAMLNYQRVSIWGTIPYV